ncbi:MAG: hypothetical protein JWM91_1310 [Rhodospirillales bacterium]|nr:hypothetical protein [Rhodospirillales bacterium]
MNIMHLRLAIVGGGVIVAFGLVSLLRFHHLPILSFTVGPLISATSWRALREIHRKKKFIEIRLTPASRRRR